MDSLKGRFALGVLCFLVVAPEYEVSGQIEVTEQCSVEDETVFDRIQADMKGVRAYDPLGPEIDTDYCARWRLGSTPITGSYMHGYCPVSDRKRVLCGSLVHVDLGEVGPESDWNHFIIPDEPFRYLIEALDDKTWSERVLCQPGDVGDSRSDVCVEAEVTPNGRLRENVENRSFPTSSEFGDDICVYGPHVVDKGHTWWNGGKPEIHPSEAVWWHKKVDARDVYHLVTIADGSTRFEGHDDFYNNFRYRTGLGSTERPKRRLPQSIRPWAGSPLRTVFDVAIRIGQDDPSLRLTVIEDTVNSWNVSTSTAEWSYSKDDPGIRGVWHDGRPMLSVADQTRADDVGLRTKHFCIREDGDLQGFVSMNTQVGTADAQGNLSLVVVVEEDGDESPSKLLLPRESGYGPRIRELKPVRASATREPDGWKSTLTSDIEVEVTGLAEMPESIEVEHISAQTSSYHSVQVTDVAYDSTADRLWMLVGRVDLTAGGYLRVELDEDRISRKLPAFGLSGYMWSHTETADPIDPKPVQGYLGLATGSDSLTSVRVRRYRAIARASYAPEKRGRLYAEESEEIDELLNEALALHGIFGGNPPLEVTWSFSGADGARLTAESVDATPVRLSAFEYAVEFDIPDDRDMMKVSAVMEDPFGFAVHLSRDFEAHGIMAGDPASAVDHLLEGVGDLMGIDLDLLEKNLAMGPAARPIDSDPAEGLRARAVSIDVHTRDALAGNGGFLPESELRKLVRSVERWYEYADPKAGDRVTLTESIEP